MRLDTAITDFLLARDRAARSEEWYADKLHRFQQWADPVNTTEELTPALIRRFLAQLKEHPGHLGRGTMSSQTIHGYARALRAFCYFGREEGWYPADWCLWWRKGMPRREQKVIKTFSPEHIRRLLLACDSRRPALRERDRAIVLLLLDTGIRASELCGLTLLNVSLGREAYATVFGKGRKQRTVGPLGRQCQRQLIRYVERYRKGDCDTVFVNDEGHPLTLCTLDSILRHLRDVAGITGVRVSAHTFRHTYAVYYLQQPGANIYKLSLLLGHSTVTTTEVYLKDFQAREARRGPSIVDAVVG